MNLLDKLRLQISGHVYVEDRMKTGWKEPIPHYAFKCPVHGIVVNYPYGYNQRLECPKCRGEQE